MSDRISTTVSAFEKTGNATGNFTAMPQQGPLVLVVIMSTIVVFEVLVFMFVLKVSWDNEFRLKKNDRHKISKFLKNMSPLKRCFLVSNIMIAIDSSIFLLRLLIPITYNNLVCSVLLRLTGSTTYSTAMTSVYIYLWARQYYLHSSPVLRNVLPIWLPILSKASLLLTITAYVVPLTVIWGMSGIDAVYKDKECYHGKSSGNVFPTIMMASTIATQLSYLVLFYATLRLHKKSNKMASGGNETLRTTFRCLCFAVVCVGTDCLAMIAIKVSLHSMPELWVHLFPKTDLLFNLLCMLFCFSPFVSTMQKAAEILTCERYKAPDEGKYGSAQSSVKTTRSTKETAVEAI